MHTNTNGLLEVQKIKGLREDALRALLLEREPNNIKKHKLSWLHKSAMESNNTHLSELHGVNTAAEVALSNTYQPFPYCVQVFMGLKSEHDKKQTNLFRIRIHEDKNGNLTVRRGIKVMKCKFDILLLTSKIQEMDEKKKNQ